jgi:stalled ribosome rescue protein Dom34
MGEELMKQQTGLWIDHKEAIIVFMGAGEGGAEVTKRMESGMEKHVRYSGHASDDGSAEDQRDRQYATHLNQYYDDVIAHIKGADAILIFGPGEAKGEFNKRLAEKGLSERVVGVETVDKMTDPQIAAKVREHFKK